MPSFYMTDLTQVQAFPCKAPGCSQVFRRREYLRRHENTHANQKPHECEKCGKSFGRRDVLVRHQRRCGISKDLDAGQSSPGTPQEQTPDSMGHQSSSSGQGNAFPRPAASTSRLDVLSHPISTVQRHRTTQSAAASSKRRRADSFQGVISRRPSIERAIDDSRSTFIAQAPLPIHAIDFSEAIDHAAQQPFPVDQPQELNLWNPPIPDWLTGMDGQNITMDYLPFETYLASSVFDVEAFLAGGIDEQSQEPVSQLPVLPTFTQPSPNTITRMMADSIPDPHSPLYIPSDRFMAYYRMRHWDIPRLNDLTSCASATISDVLPHLDFLHGPTFRLDMLATCLAFSVCVVGALVQPDAHQWDTASVARNELTTTLMRSFSMAKEIRMSEYNCALNQALVLLQSPQLLSDAPAENIRGCMYRSSIINTARQVGLLDPSTSHCGVGISLPPEPWTFSEVDLYWRRWVQLESRRRTAYFLFIFDTNATAQSSIPHALTPIEICSMPMPAPQSIWTAETAAKWLSLSKPFKPLLLRDLMRHLFNPAEHRDPDKIRIPSLSHSGLTAAMITIVRCIVDIGEGRRESGSWCDLTDTWSERDEAEQWALETFPGIVTRAVVLDRFTKAIERWKGLWDDPALGNPGRDQAGRLSYSQDAMPFFWLGQALLNVVSSSSPMEVRRKFVTQISLSEMLASAKSFTRMGNAEMNVSH